MVSKCLKQAPASYLPNFPELSRASGSFAAQARDCKCNTSELILQLRQRRNMQASVMAIGKTEDGPFSLLAADYTSSNSSGFRFVGNRDLGDTGGNAIGQQTTPDIPDVKIKNRLAQKRFRDRNKQKFDILEETVLSLSKRLEDLELRKLKLHAEINVLQTQQNLRKHAPRIILPQIQKVEPDFVPAVSWAGFNPAGQGGLVLQAVFDEPRRLTKQQASKLSVQDIRDFNEEFLVRAGNLLVQNPEEDTQSPAGLKLKELVAERNGFCCYMAFWLPMSFTKLNDPVDGDGLRLETPDYKHVVGSLKLTPNQKQELRSATKEYLLKAHNLSFQLAELQAELLAMHIEEPTLLPLKQKQSLKFANLVRRLRDVVDLLHIAQCMFWGKIFSNPEQLNYFQEARLLLEAWPYIPDPEELYSELERQMTGKTVRVEELPSQLPVVKQEYDEYEETPYVDVSEKMMTEFSKLGIWSHLGGAESSPAVIKYQQN